MASPVPSAVVIECPKCGTRYQLPSGTIGPQGRKVACAHCGEAWNAKPVAIAEPPAADALFDEEAESDLDAAFAEAEAAVLASDPDREARERTLAEIRAAIAPSAPADPQPAGASHESKLRKLERDFMRRQADVRKGLPVAKVRRAVRLVAVAALVLMIGAGIIFRTDIVRQIPDLAGMYEALGLGVNVVGLELRDATTLIAVRGGSRIMQVDARIFSVAPRRVAIPRIVVTVVDATGRSIYEWSALADVAELQPGEIVDFSTQLASPPADAHSVRLSFADSPAPAGAQPPLADAQAPPAAETLQESAHHG